MKSLQTGINVQWFCHTFITTYMAFISQTMDPWDVLVKQSVLIMQKIWDATSTYEYEVTASTTVHKKVRDQLASRVIYITTDFQRVQRLANSWQNAIGSTGIAAILMFCDSHEDLQDSALMKNTWNSPSITSKIFTFCTKTLTTKTKRSVMLIITLVVHVSNNSQKWRGLFHSPFILQKFAAHLSAIDGSVWVPGLHDKPTPCVVGALGLAAASV